ncbi:hypothetical protein P3T76_010615 [Phytophthora citrophthora]|uniref:RxLR effector protein n=1 Tax=Phytophthora citrophthora TaxID=4793 RepID=A0AAD9LGA7_9STRA|nr:hypothetical protein P3T76_010615 [Phytophthora citrophthora]
MEKGYLKLAQQVDDFTHQHHNMLQRKYGEEQSKALEKADKIYGVALKLQREQMNAWKHKGLTTDELFGMYKLDNGTMNLLETPGIKIWTRYADEFNPGEPTTLFKKLQKTYSDEYLSKILIKGKTVSRTEELASDLQNQQIRH